MLGKETQTGNTSWQQKFYWYMVEAMR